MQKEAFTEALNPVKISWSGNSAIIYANPDTDLINKFQKYKKDSAAFNYIKQLGDFTFSAHVKVNGHNAFDALFIMVRESGDHWIKLALELGVDSNYNVVSVITNEWSDDGNGELLPGNECWLRITRKGDFWGLHYSIDGSVWRFVRAFGMQLEEEIMIGFGIQSPLGDQCSGMVGDLYLSQVPVENFRDGN